MTSQDWLHKVRNDSITRALTLSQTVDLAAEDGFRHVLVVDIYIRYSGHCIVHRVFGRCTIAESRFRCGALGLSDGLMCNFG
jgi:hypothetical protein